MRKSNANEFINENKNLYVTLFSSTFKISACTFGGGYVIVPLMKKRFVEELGWISETEMLDFISISQSAPGPIAVDVAIMVGYHVCGLKGAVIAGIGTILPPLIIISVISLFYKQFRDNRFVSFAMNGMLAGIAAVNLSCGYYNAHTTSEEVNMEEMFHTINIVSELLEDEAGKKVQFEYIPDACSLSNYYYGYDSSYCGEWFAPDDYIVELEVMYVDKNGKWEEDIVEGCSEADAWTTFFMTHGDICFNDVTDYYVYRN